jgi:alkanesulfonate monooxygenase SsuD/methylene tetrahydromethanopterin reductase-like flavin-dependent oxidoreductase (luciferase family)
MIRVGLLLPTREAAISGDWDARRLAGLARRAEELGFDSVWAGDSLLARPRFEPLTLLAAVAIATRSVALGAAALTVPLRHPLHSAHAVTAVDQLCGGRLIIGMGAGFPYPASAAEFAAVGVPFTQRLGRLIETAQIWRHVWGDASGSAFSGKYWKFGDIDGFPRPTSPGGPPLWLAGSGPRALAHAGAALDSWLPYPPDPASYEQSRTVLKAAATAAGRPHAAVTPGLYVTVLPHDDPEAGRAELDAYVRAYYGQSLPLMRRMQGFVTGTDEQCVAQLRGYADAGARHIVIRIGSLDPPPLLERVAALAGQVRSWS